ncbi:DUF1120 domain-containing protein [Ewingella americana]|nr:DUF1120 domain-containing protein [Ewingella americana]
MPEPSPTASVQVKGSVTPGACVPTLDNGGVINLGEIATSTIGTSGLRISDKAFNLVVTCSNPTTFQ